MVRNYVRRDVEQSDRVTNKVLKAGVQTSYVHSSINMCFLLLGLCSCISWPTLLGNKLFSSHIYHTYTISSLQFNLVNHFTSVKYTFMFCYLDVTTTGRADRTSGFGGGLVKFLGHLAE